MNAMLPFLFPLRRLTRFGSCALLGLLLLPVARADVLTVRNRTKGPVKTLVSVFPPPTGNLPSSPTLLVFPLLGRERRLLPGGKLLVWVGRNDGTPYASATVPVRVPDSAEKNTLVSAAGQRVHEVTLTTNAQGLAEVYLTVPEVPPPNNGDNGGNGGDGGDEGGGE